MSFQQLNKEILFQVTDDFAVDLPEKDKDDITKKEIIAALKRDGVTWEMYKEAFPSVFDQDDVDPDEALPTLDGKEYEDEEEDEEEEKTAIKQFKAGPKKQVLVKMTRANGSFQIRGYNFTREHPYLPVNEDDAVYLTEEQRGFKIANPREVEEYYS